MVAKTSKPEDAEKTNDAAEPTPGSRRVGTAAKKPWQRPTIDTGPLFESNSLACGKNAPFTDECQGNPLQS